MAKKNHKNVELRVQLFDAFIKQFQLNRWYKKQLKAEALKDSPMFAYRNRNDELTATLGGLSTTGGLRGANLMNELDQEHERKGISAKKKA